MVVVVVVVAGPAAGAVEEAGICRPIAERSGLPSLLDEMLDIYIEKDQHETSIA